MQIHQQVTENRTKSSRVLDLFASKDAVFLAVSPLIQDPGKQKKTVTAKFLSLLPLAGCEMWGIIFPMSLSCIKLVSCVLV